MLNFAAVEYTLGIKIKKKIEIFITLNLRIASAIFYSNFVFVFH